MIVNKYKYKTYGEIKKIYVNESKKDTIIKLNRIFATSVVDTEDEMKGVYGKFLKSEKLYRLKYIYTRNKQLQPQTFDRFYYLMDVGEDENGTFIEYVLVYDRFFEPLIRMVYILAALFIIAYLYYSSINGGISRNSAIVLSVIIALSVVVLFKKSKESADECKYAERIIDDIIKDL